VHETASYGSEFFEEETTAGVTLGSGARRRPSTSGHVVGSTYYAGRLLALTDGVRNAVREADGVELAPGSLAEVDASTASEYARFVLIAAYSRLGFSTPAQELLADVDAFANTERRADQGAEELLMSLRVPAETRAWVYLEAFRMHRARSTGSPELAYRYGVRARACTTEAPGSDTGLGKSDEVVAWTETLEGQFRSSRGTLFGPFTPFCEESGEEVIDFTFYRALP